MGERRGAGCHPAVGQAPPPPSVRPFECEACFSCASVRISATFFVLRVDSSDGVVWEQHSQSEKQACSRPSWESTLFPLRCFLLFLSSGSLDYVLHLSRVVFFLPSLGILCKAIEFPQCFVPLMSSFVVFVIEEFELDWRPCKACVCVCVRERRGRAAGVGLT